MRKFLAILLISLFLISDSFACSCPLDADYWWRKSNTVVLVKITSVTSDFEISRKRIKCKPTDDRCVQKQIAKFTIIETFKGNGKTISSLATRYGDGDCGIPLIAGTYYVLFLRDSSGTVGMCNAAGPYLREPPFPYGRPDQFEKFIDSIRKASKNPLHKVIAQPEPISIGSGR